MKLALRTTLITASAAALLLTSTQALAKDKAPAPAPSGAPAATTGNEIGGSSERVNVENIKQKYWARGDESELGVVQNRLYSKDKKFELGLFGGLVTTDPFLSVSTLGASMGFHFSEYVAVNALGYRSFVTPSSALATLEKPLTEGGLGTTANTNEPRWYAGGEGVFSPIYGKLSVMGKAIIHYDLHVMAGAGMTNTQSGTYLTPHVGIGQQIYLAKRVSLRLDYRLMLYQEEILEKVQISRAGQSNGTRTNYTNSITLGVNFLIDPFGKKQPDAQQQ